MSKRLVHIPKRLIVVHVTKAALLETDLEAIAVVKHDQIRYWWQSLTEMERVDGTTRQEFFAVVWAVLMLQTYLERARLLDWTDLNFLNWIRILSD